MSVALGLGLSALNNIIQAEYNDRAMGAQHYYNLESMRASQKGQYEYGEKAAANADLRQRAMYEDYMTYKAQVKQMQEAGLNPALMYGGGGASGAGNMPHAAQGNGANASASGVTTLGLLTEQMGAQAMQTELIQSQVEKNLADAASTRGEKGTVGAAQIAVLAKDASLKNAQTVGLQIENAVKQKLNEAQINLLQTQSQVLMQSVSNEIQKITLAYKQFRLEQEKFKESKRVFDLSRKDANRKWASEFMTMRQHFNRSIDNQIKSFETHIETIIGEGKKKRRQEILNGILHTTGSIIEGLILGTMFRGGGGALKAGTILPAYGATAGKPDMYGRDWL